MFNQYLWIGYRFCSDLHINFKIDFLTKYHSFLWDYERKRTFSSRYFISTIMHSHPIWIWSTTACLRLVFVNQILHACFILFIYLSVFTHELLSFRSAFWSWLNFSKYLFFFSPNQPFLHINSSKRGFFAIQDPNGQTRITYYKMLPRLLRNCIRKSQQM